MRLKFTRTGASTSARVARKTATPSAEWRTWAHEVAQAHTGDKPVVPVVFTFQPTARDARGLGRLDLALPVVKYVLEGLTAGGLLPGTRSDVCEIRMLAPRVTGADGMIVTLADAREPF